MKKFLTILAIIALTLASCSKDKENCNCNNDNGNNGGTKTPTATIKPNQIMLGFPKDFKKFNIPEFIPANYSFYYDVDRGVGPIINDPNLLEQDNKVLNAFFEKYNIVNSDGFEFTHSDTGVPFITKEDKKEATQIPYKIKPIYFYDNPPLPPLNPNSVFGLDEKENIVVFYNFDLYDLNILKGGEFRLKAFNFYKFATKEAYKEYVNMLRSIYVDDYEKYHFYDLPVKPLPLIYCGNAFKLSWVGGDSALPSFIPKTIDNEKVRKKVAKSSIALPFSYYNTGKTMESLNHQYKNAFEGKYRFEIYYKYHYIDNGDYAMEPFNLFHRGPGDHFLSIQIGGSRISNYIDLLHLIIKPIPEHKAIAFYEMGGLKAFLLFPNDESYNEYMAMLKDIFNTPEAQETIFLNF